LTPNTRSAGWVCGTPATLNRQWTGAPIRSSVVSMDDGSPQSVSYDPAHAPSIGAMSRACTSAPASTSIATVAFPMPDAAPVTITRFSP